jgi:hypothetical protein
MITNIIFINGIYDIICGISILFFPKSFFANIHISIFNEEYKNNDLIKRLIAYWVITQGVIRFSIIFENSLIINNLIALSYLIEAYSFSNEYFLFNTTNYYKTLFIIILSLILFILIINKKTKNY